MKKILCIILSLLTILNTFATVGIVSFGISDNISLSTFVFRTKEMIDDYGLYAETAPDSFQTFSAEETENEFMTRRLIVKSESNIDTLNAVSIVSGFRNLWVLQFETEEDTATAYEYYCSLDSVEFVEIDSLVTVSEMETVTSAVSTKSYLSWGPEHIGFDELNEIIAENHIKLETVYVAVIDTGVDYNHEFLEDRVDVTTFNVSDSGNENDPLDDDGHGTHVAGIIVDCTPENVIIKPYKCFNSKGEGTDLMVSSGIYQAADDGNDVINMSFGSPGESKLLDDALAYAKEKSDPVMVAAIGNEGTNSGSVMPMPAKSPLVIAVSAIEENNELSRFSNFSKSIVELTAPGGAIKSSICNNEYDTFSGTSMATPFVSAVSAMASAIYPQYSSSDIRSLMNQTALPLTTDRGNRGYFGYGMVYATGLIENISSSIGVECVSAPTFSIDEGTYEETINVELLGGENTEIFYTTDGSIPTKNSFLYSGEPIEIDKTTMILATAYENGKIKSPISSAHYRLIYTVEWKDVILNSEGYILGLRGDFEAIEIPEIITYTRENETVDRKVIGIGDDAFSLDINLKYIKLPDSVKTIGNEAFYGCKNLETIIANGVVQIDNYAFYNCEMLNSYSFDKLEVLESDAFNNAGSAFESSCSVYFPNLKSIPSQCFGNSNISSIYAPNVTEIGERAFLGNKYLSYIEFPKVSSIEEDAFRNCTLIENANFPSLVNLGDGAFSGCDKISEVDMPKLKEMYVNSFSEKAGKILTLNFPELTTIYTTNLSRETIPKQITQFYAPKLKAIPKSTFYNCQKLREVDLSSVETIGKDAFSFCGKFNEFDFVDFSNVISAESLPSNCKILFSSKLTSVSCTSLNLTIYGTSGTYAEEFAASNGHKFIPLPCITNVLPNTVSDQETLSVEAIGFNLKYQWYGSSSPKYQSGVAIEGATKNSFDVDKYKQYRYYYCVITSNDFGCEPTEALTAMCNNLSYVYTPPTSNGKITIATPSNRYLKYGESINLYANATGLPEGAKIKWRIVEGSGVTLDPSVSGKICTVTSKSNGNVIIEAYAVNKNGNTIVDEKGNRIYDREGISSEISLWWVILYYIRQMFSISNTAINSLL